MLLIAILKITFQTKVVDLSVRNHDTNESWYNITFIIQLYPGVALDKLITNN